MGSGKRLYRRRFLTICSRRTPVIRCFAETISSGRKRRERRREIFPGDRARGTRAAHDGAAALDGLPEDGSLRF